MFDEAFRFEPQLVHVGAGPAFAVPAKFVVGAIGASFELIEQQVVEDLLSITGGSPYCV